MFTTLETEENDVFSCNICDDIFVSKDGIKNHIVENHQEEDFEDSGSDENIKKDGLNNSEKENYEIKDFLTYVRSRESADISAKSINNQI